MNCPECRGHGADPLSDNVNWLPCRSCGGSGEVKARQAAERLPGTCLIDYPYQIRDGVMSHLILPVDLTRAEFERLNRFLESLIDE